MSEEDQPWLFTEEPEALSGGHDSGRDELRSLVDENFLEYASYVIRDRAIPNVEDGLKPVQRRILWALHESDDGKFIKVANVVGHTMQYHPHGDASIGDALVSLVNRGYLIEGQGNFGNIFTGDPAAAPRYIECRLTEPARKQIFNDALTRMIPSYDGRKKEPVTLPAKLPLLLMLGADGIAVGLSTRILPHNVRELLEAMVAVLQKKPFSLVPDFQQAGRMDTTEYEDGNGKVKVRAVIEERDAKTLVVREIPYGTSTESLIASVEDAARKKKLNIRSIKDYTAEQVEIEVKIGGNISADAARQALYAFTHCEVSHSVRGMVIRDNRPVRMSVSEILRYNTDRLVELLRQELELEKKRLEDEFHRKSLVQIFVENRIYKQIEECETYAEVQTAVFEGVNAFRDQLMRDITKDDVEMLLGIPVKRISRFDINKNRKDLDTILKDLAKVEKDLKRLVPYAVKYLKGLLKEIGDSAPRRTVIESFETVEVRELTADELTLSYDKEKGYLGYSIEGEPLFSCSSYDKVVAVQGDGRYRVMPPPEKQFVDKDLVYADVASRDKVFTLVYTNGGITYMKRFQFGGAIQNREYRCAPEDSKILIFEEGTVDAIYVKYAKAKRQRITQQIFKTADLPVRTPKAKGLQMTVKKIKWIGTAKPRGWQDSKDNPDGALIDF